MLDVAIRRLDGQTVVDLGRNPGTARPPLPVSPALATLLPTGLRRGSTVSVAGSMALLLALLGGASATGAWCVLVGLPTISAEAAVEQGIELSRLAIVAPTDPIEWATAVGALLDAVDIVAARPPPRLAPGDIRRLAARARSHDAVLITYLGTGTAGTGTAAEPSWPGTDVRLRAVEGEWSGIATGSAAGQGRLRQRRLTVRVEGRGQAARPRTAALWLPGSNGGVELAAPVVRSLDAELRRTAPVDDLAS
jgi:hypothetical protein